MAVEISNLAVEDELYTSSGNKIKVLMEGLNGVEWVRIDLKSRQVTVGYDPEKVTFQKIKETLGRQGFEVS